MVSYREEEALVLGCGKEALFEGCKIFLAALNV
jgi:hypothetical protein